MGKALTQAKGHQLVGMRALCLLIGRALAPRFVRWHGAGAEGTSSLQPAA